MAARTFSSLSLAREKFANIRPPHAVTMSMHERGDEGELSHEAAAFCHGVSGTERLARSTTRSHARHTLILRSSTENSMTHPRERCRSLLQGTTNSRSPAKTSCRAVSFYFFYRNRSTKKASLSCTGSFANFVGGNSSREVFLILGYCLKDIRQAMGKEILRPF